MKCRFAIVLLLLAAAARAQQVTPEPNADNVVQHELDMAAGPAWASARYFTFTFVLERDGKVAASFPQRYDRISGQYRVSGVDPQGKKFEAAMNVNTKEGKAWIDGAEVTGEKLASTLSLAYRRYQNDIFWLLMQFKLREQLTRRLYAGSRDDACGHTWDLVKVTFEGGFGFSPRDVYTIWISRETGLIDYWDMQLVGAPSNEPVTVRFRDYQRINGLLISTTREMASKKQIVRLEQLQVLPEPPKGAFE